jgi:hypothetical protein
MTEERNEAVETRLAKSTRTGSDEPANEAVTDRDDCNDYATYWQARSGFFDLVPDAHRHHA